ncbi:hypothetical protein GJ496_008978 [Pomphorhynchus laevis]|nr:hypothetical protein GJ496_008978 [Pomphorhynchus laevis]
MGHLSGTLVYVKEILKLMMLFCGLLMAAQLFQVYQLRKDIGHSPLVLLSGIGHSCTGSGQLPLSVDAWFALLTFAKSVLRLPNSSSAKNATRHCSLERNITKHVAQANLSRVGFPKISAKEFRKKMNMVLFGVLFGSGELKHMHRAKMSQAAGESDCCETSQTGDTRNFITVVLRGSVSNASAGDKDGLSPFHLKDLVSVSRGAAGPL